MFSRLTAFVRKELAYLSELSADERKLLSASILFGLAQPMINVFSNTFLWRQSGNAVVLAVFSIGFYAGLCLGFLLNGLGLKWFKPTTLFFLGCALQGAVPVLLVYAGASADELALPLGLALGVAGGFFWGNRNLLTATVTGGTDRFKYISLDTAFGLGAAIVSPLIIGWFLVFGEKTGFYAAQSAYEVTAIFGFLLLTVAGSRVARIKRKFEKVSGIFLTNRSPAWQKMRLLDFVNGFTDGFERVIPLLILLLFLGKEDSIGVVQSAASILSFLGIYAIGKRARHKDHVRIIGMWTVVTSVGKAVFAILYSSAGALIFHGFNGLVLSFRAASMSAVMFEAVDHEPGEGISKRYRYIMDREFVLDAGRVLGLLSFIGLFTWSASFTVRYGLLLSIGTQLLMVILVKVVTRLVPHEEVPITA